MSLRQFLKQAQLYLEKVQSPYLPAERLLYGFSSAEDLARWKVFTDQEYGGHSTAELALSSDEQGTPTASFHGSISTDVDAGHEGRRMQRSGFAGINTEAVEGQYLDMDGTDALAFRVRGDGRAYIASLRTDNWIVGSASHDVWQAFLFARPGQWHNVVIPLERFLQTHKGRLVETRSAMNPHRIISLGVSVAGGAGSRGFDSAGLATGNGSSMHSPASEIQASSSIVDSPGGASQSSSSSLGSSRDDLEVSSGSSNITFGGRGSKEVSAAQGPFRLGLAWIKGVQSVGSPGEA